MWPEVPLLLTGQVHVLKNDGIRDILGLSMNIPAQSVTDMYPLLGCMYSRLKY